MISIDDTTHADNDILEEASFINIKNCEGL